MKKSGEKLEEYKLCRWVSEKASSDFHSIVDFHPIQWGVEILLVASRYRNLALT